MTSATLDFQTQISLLMSGLSLDSNAYNESQLQARSSGRRLLQPSLSLPPESSYIADITGASANDTTFLPTRLPAPKSADQRTQSIGDTAALHPAVGQEVFGSSKQASTTSPTRYKTELCRPFEENGTCRYGSKCQFAHGKGELRSVVRHPKYKTDRCRTYHTTGLCPYGPRCHFIHNDDERRNSESSSEQARHLAVAQELGRRSSSLWHAHSMEERPRLQRQFSEYQPRSEPRPRGVATPGDRRTGPSVDLHRRASAAADAVIRNYQYPLQTVLESDQYFRLNVHAAATRSLGSSSASSVTNSPSPSPTAGLLLPAVEDPVTPTATVRQPPSAVPDDVNTRAALIAEVLARLGPHDLAALLLQLPGNATSTNSGTPVAHGSDVQSTAPQWPEGHSSSTMQYDHSQYQHHYPQQHGPTANNICW